MKLALKLATVLLVATAIALPATNANAQTAYALAAGGANLISFDLATPGIVTTFNIASAGNVNDRLDAIDFRSNGVLYGYNTTTDTVYTVSTVNGAITPVAGSATGTPQETTTPNLGMDFNPTTGANDGAAFRIVTSNDENCVFNVVTGTYTFTADNLRFVGNSNGDGAIVVENAYTNNLIGATSTTQYAIEQSTSSLYTLDNNGGQLTLVGGLGLNVNPTTVGFDIITTLGGTNNAYAIFQNEANSNASSLYAVDLVSGAAVLQSALGNGTLTGVRSLAITPVVVPEAGSAQLVMWAMVTGAFVAANRRRTSKSLSL